MKNIIVIGATSSIAQACVQQWSEREQKIQFHLIARDIDKLSLVSADLKTRYPHINIQSYIVDALAIEQLIEQLQHICQATHIDLCFMAQGIMYLDEQNLPPRKIADLIQLNCSSIAASTDIVYQYMQKQGSGKIAVIGSVAGDRGRKANYLYGASKAFVATYIRGLQHKIALNHEHIQVNLIKPGPTESEMTAHLVAQGKKLAPVKDVAKIIVDGVEHGKATIYAPKIWRIIMLVIQHLPFFVFKKLDI